MDSWNPLPPDASPDRVELYVRRLQQENERLRAENMALREATACPENLVASILKGLLALDACWNVSYVNRHAAAALGAQPAELLGKNLWETFPALLGTVQEQACRRVMDDRTFASVQFQGINDSSRYLWVIYPIEDRICVVWHDITEQQRIDEARCRSEAMLQGILDAAQASIVLYEDDRIVHANEAALAWMGKAHEELIGKRIDETEPTEHTRDRLARLREVAASGHSVEFEDEQDGRVMHHRLHPIAGASGQVRWVACFSQDVTADKRHDQVLRHRTRELEAARADAESQARRLRAVMEALPIGVSIIDPVGGMAYENRAFGELWGNPRPAPRSLADYLAYKATWAESGRPITPEEWAASRAIQYGETVVGQLVAIQRFDGVPRVVLGSAAPIRDPEGTIVACVATLQDITDLRKVEAALRESEARLRLALAASEMGIWEWDLATNQVLWDDEISRMLGLPPGVESSIEAGFARLFPEDRALLEEALQRGFVDNSDRRRIVRVGWPDGTLHALEVRARFVRDPEGRVVRCYGVLQDVTERIRTEEALREEDRRKNEFLGVLSHELRNPLAPIRNSLHILEHAAASPEIKQRALGVIERQVNQLSRLVDDLLDVTRIRSGKIRIQKERVNLNELARRVVDDHRSIFQDSKVTLEFWPCSHPLVLHVDPARLSQVMGNLLYNAVKFTESGGRTDLFLEEAAEPPMAVLRVRDTGAGMRSETIERLFVPFVQAETTLHRSRGGLGLGLALVKSIVELHGGKVVATSEGPGRGSELVVSLPLGVVPVSAVPPKDLSRPLRMRRVLIVEDNLDAADSLRDLLELSGHLVQVAHDGIEGIALARTFRPDIIFCDIGLPRMDGYTVARALRADKSLEPLLLVALTGYALADDIAQGKDAGFDAHIAKPPNMAEIERLLAQ